MDTLVHDLYILILATLPDFASRRSLGHVNKAWHRAYRTLCRPYNDDLSSRFLDLHAHVPGLPRYGPYMTRTSDYNWSFEFEFLGPPKSLLLRRRFMVSADGTKLFFLRAAGECKSNVRF